MPAALLYQAFHSAEKLVLTPLLSSILVWTLIQLIALNCTRRIKTSLFILLNYFSGFIKRQLLLF